MRIHPILITTLLVSATFVLATGSAWNPCPDQPTHSYFTTGTTGMRSSSADTETKYGSVRVFETNVSDCDGDGLVWDFDGDFETGIGGGFFGYGTWVDDPDCSALNAHGPNVNVNDFTWGNGVAFVVGEDDQSGPTKIYDPLLGKWQCETDGAITPGNPAADPNADADDCLSQVFIGTGHTCGSGGGDGGYWVILVMEAGETGAGYAYNPATSGVITAF